MVSCTNQINITNVKKGGGKLNREEKTQGGE